MSKTVLLISPLMPQTCFPYGLHILVKAAPSLLRPHPLASALTPLFLLYLISKSIRKCHYFNLQNISWVQSLFTIFTSSTLIQVTITSYLNYCNNLSDHSAYFCPPSVCAQHLLEYQSDHVTPLHKNSVGFCHIQVELSRKRYWVGLWSVRC